MKQTHKLLKFLGIQPLKMLEKIYFGLCQENFVIIYYLTQSVSQEV